MGLPLLLWKVSLGMAVGIFHTLPPLGIFPFLEEGTLRAALLRGIVLGLLFVFLAYPLFLNRVRPRLSASTKRGAAYSFPFLAISSEIALFITSLA